MIFLTVHLIAIFGHFPGEKSLTTSQFTLYINMNIKHTHVASRSPRIVGSILTLSMLGLAQSTTVVQKEILFGCFNGLVQPAWRGSSVL
jgi:hypothetical protein